MRSTMSHISWTMSPWKIFSKLEWVSLSHTYRKWNPHREFQQEKYIMNLFIAELNAIFYNYLNLKNASLAQQTILRDKQRQQTTKQQHVVQFFNGFNWNGSKTHCPIRNSEHPIITRHQSHLLGIMPSWKFSLSLYVNLQGFAWKIIHQNERRNNYSLSVVRSKKILRSLI